MIVQRCDCRGQCQIVTVERLANAIHQIGDFSRSQRVANTQTSEAVDLREGAGNHQIRELGQPGHRIGTVGQRQILVVGLVENHHDILRHHLQEGFQRSEFLLEHGFLDFIVNRKDLKEDIARLLLLFKS